ncbi:MAG: hypothetical protein IH921_08425 [Gemmatimonadetes bacterium]|nr:hypothetical protein [Gemmatimonadota bacterium]
MFTAFGAAPDGLPTGPVPAAAHEVRPGYLELRETSPGVFRVLWKKPARGDMILKIDPVFPDGCAVVGIGSATMRGGAYVARATLECVDGLTGKAIEIAGLEATLTDVLIKVYYATQPETRPPTFVLFCNYPELVHFSYLRYIENQIRARNPLEGTPIRVVVRSSRGRDGL